MKHFYALLLALVLTAMVGCADSSASQSEADHRVSLTFMMGQSHYKDFMKDALERFEEEYPHISIDPQIVPDTQWNTLVKRKVAVGETPDLIRIDRGLLANVGTTHFVELTEQEPWYSRVLPEQLRIKMVNGKLYGLPVGGNSYTGLVCNAALFEQYNVGYPTTMDELIAACETFKAAGVTPLYASDGDAWTVGMAFAATAPQTVPPEIWDQLRLGKLHWQDVPEFSEILSTFAALRQEGYTNENYLEATYASAVDSVAQGQAAMYIGGQYFIQDVLTIDPSKNLRMMAVPYHGDVLSIKLGMGQISIFANSEHIEEAKLFLDWFSQPENMNQFNAGWGHTPVYVDQTVDQTDWEQDVQQRYILSGKTVPTTNIILDGVDFDPFWKYQQELMAGIHTIDEVLLLWDKNFQKQLEKGIFESPSS